MTRKIRGQEVVPFNMTMSVKVKNLLDAYCEQHGITKRAYIEKLILAHLGSNPSQVRTPIKR